MSEERPVEEPAAPETPEAGGEPEEPKLLGGKYKSPEELAKAYGELESKLGESGANLKRFEALRAQVESLGLEIGDDGTMRYAGGAPEAGREPISDDEDIEAKVERLTRGLAEMGQTLDVATRTIAAGSKQQLLSHVPEPAKAKAEELYDQMLNRVPARQRLDKDTQDAVRRVIMGQLLEEGAFNVPAGETDDPAPGGKVVNLGKLVPETSRPSGGGGTQKRSRLTGSAKEAHDGLSSAMAEMGIEMTEAETAEGIEAVRRRRGSVE